MTLDRLAAVHYLHRDLVLVHILGKAVILFLDLKSKLARVTHDKDGYWLGIVFELVERSEHKNCGFSHA